ncbi:hypothetical protein LZ30DRAFT_785620 [Colletotrichum cereale]|nr:hypothetical protein LZ30DRAFT_785620 [Colletotrichum cereale]
MAESLAALGVAANIVQFLELGLKAAISIVEIYRSVNDDGWTARHVDLDSMAKDLRARCDRLKEDADIKLDPAMTRLLQRCIDTADELSSELRGLAGGNAKRHQKWARLKVTLAAYFRRGKINEIQARLLEIKTHVFEQLQILLHDNRKSLSKSMRSLEQASEGWNRATEKRLNALAQDLSNLCKSQSAAAASTEGLRIFSETWARVSEEAKNQATVVAILTSLRFTQIKERQSEIPKAHRRTFQWVFSDDSPVDLSDWLRESSGLFWITGKPGSGKSTLMKFILGHEQTMLLAERPKKRLESWSIEDLSEVFGRLKDIRPLSSRILLLIDGLDEYSGNLRDLVQFLRSTSESPYIKVCCASRPWPVFLNGFDNVSGRIYMHELTVNDMMRYIRDTLGQHSYFETLKQSQEMEAAKIVKNIADKSEGVFFWVSLVVKSLLRGLDNSDDLAILQQRLSEFPSDLDKFFQRMLNTIDPVYKDSAAMVFSMLLLANSSLPLVVFAELKRLVAALNDHEAKLERSDISFFAAEDIRLYPSEDDFSINQVNRRKDQILAQCRDLVQVWDVAGPYGSQYNTRVGFLHRTVVEFLERPMEAQWQHTLPFKRYLPARSYLSFIAVREMSQNSPREFQSRTREFVLRFLYTLQGADLQEMAESHRFTEELFDGLLRCLNLKKIPFFVLVEIEEMKLLLTQARARTWAVGMLGARQFFDGLITPLDYHSFSKSLPWWLRDSGYVEVGDRAQVSWPRVVDLEVLDALLDHDVAMYSIHNLYPAAFATFLLNLSRNRETRLRNDLLVCKTMIEHGFAGSMERSKRAAGTSPAQVVSEGANDSALTRSSTIEWLRLNRVFSDSELLELEEAFPLEAISTPPFLRDQKERERIEGRFRETRQVFVEAGPSSSSDAVSW